MEKAEMVRKGFGIAIIFLVAFSGCTPKNIDAPEPDFDLVRTQAVQTAVMQITADAVLHPKTTPSSELSAATDEGETSQQTVGNSQDKGNTSQSDPTPASLDNDEYACQVESEPQYPSENSRGTGETYTGIWRIRNTGSAIWRSDQVTAEWVGGAHLCTRDRIELGWNIHSGESVEIRVPILVPDSLSSTPKMMAWGLVDGNGRIFCKFYTFINEMK
jgi:hypothetical protein